MKKIELKTALMTGSYLVGNDPSGSPREERLWKWIGWHYPMLSDLGADQMYLSDNASPWNKLLALPQKPVILRYQEHLERGYGPENYPYCWRHLYTVKILMALGYEKIIIIDSDCFVVSKRMVDALRSIQKGWQAFWIPKFEFPSAECQVLCKDAFPVYDEFTDCHFNAHLGKLMERELPFTHINKEMKVDRWGESKTPQEPWMDLYCQASTDLKFVFNGD